MHRIETSTNDSATAFPSTQWSDVLAAADKTHPECRERLDRLLRMYWKPVFVYIRIFWRKTIEDAKDLTQAFFTEFLEKDYLSRLRPERGSFRAYLKQALRHFLVDAARAASARKRKQPLIRIDATPAELERLGMVAPEETPDRAFEKEWFRTVLDVAVQQMQEQLSTEGKARYFEVFRAYCLERRTSNPGRRTSVLAGTSHAGAPTYRQLAKRLGISESDVRNYLWHCRGLLRQLLAEHVRAYVPSDADVETELKQIDQT